MLEELEPDELLETIEQIKMQTYSVSRRQIILNLIDQEMDYPHEEAFIYQQLDEAFNETFENMENMVKKERQFHFPHVKERDIKGTKVKITVTHRGQAEKVYGVDLIYEIEGKKVAAFQHKKANRKSKLKIDKDQLRKIIRICSDCRRFTHTWMDKGYVIPGCVVFYVIDSPKGVQGVVSACQLEKFVLNYNKNSDEIYRLVERKTIDDAFVKCIVGYDLTHETDGRGPIENQYDTFLIDQHLVFDVLLSRIPPKQTSARRRQRRVI